MADVELSDEVEEVDLLDAAVIGEVVQQTANVAGTGNHALDHSAECLKYRRIVDRCEEELYFSYIHLIFSKSFLKFVKMLIPGFGLGELEVSFVGKNEYAAVVSVFGLKIVVDGVEGVH